MSEVISKASAKGEQGRLLDNPEIRALIQLAYEQEPDEFRDIIAEVERQGVQPSQATEVPLPPVSPEPIAALPSASQAETGVMSETPLAQAADNNEPPATPSLNEPAAPAEQPQGKASVSPEQLKQNLINNLTSEVESNQVDPNTLKYFEDYIDRIKPLLRTAGTESNELLRLLITLRYNYGNRPLFTQTYPRLSQALDEATASFRR